MKTTKKEGDKISKSELDQILGLEDTKRALLIRVGELESDKLTFLGRLQQTLLQQNDMKEKLNKKYGLINIDLNTGQYTRQEEQPNAPEKKLEIVE